MDLPQILLLVIIVVIAVILTVIGVQLINLLKEAKTTLKKLDNILSDVEFLTNNLTRSSTTLSHLSEGLKSGMQLVGTIAQLVSAKKKK